MTRIPLCFLLFLSSVVSEGYRYGNINTCGTKYVKPGDDFTISCRTDHGVLTRMYTPAELDVVPSDQQLLRQAQRIATQRELVGERTTTINEYEDATKGVDDGYYTCVVFHGNGHDPLMSRDECLVIIKDLCEDSSCQKGQECVPDYDSGTHQCICKEECAFVFDPLCSSRCEQFVNECFMDVQSCKDGKERAVSSKGMCPAVVVPQVRTVDSDIVADDYGETVVLTSGVLDPGSPPVQVKWEFFHEDGSPPETLSPPADPYQLTLTEDNVGTYRITITQCMDENSAVFSEYRVSVDEDQFELEFNKPEFHHTCSVYPGGAVEGFNGVGIFYDLACSHVLAADFRPGGDYTSPWFVYGTFDQKDGKTALSHMTFYTDEGVFEVERGWIVHQHGEKMILVEGVEQAVGGCTVLFQHFHIKVHCPHFTAMYDGVMAGHIIMKPAAEEPYSPLKKKSSNVGLCFDAKSGRRPNWQVGNTAGKCQINTSEEPCEESPPEACNLNQPPAILTGYSDLDWTSCGSGASVGCGELRCEGNTPTPMQQCALEQANRVSCAMKYGRETALLTQDVTCPDDPCVWKKQVVASGCPQEYPPHNCQ